MQIGLWLQFNKSIYWSRDTFIHRMATAKPLLAGGGRENWKPLSDNYNCMWQQKLLEKKNADIRYCVFSLLLLWNIFIQHVIGEIKRKMADWSLFFVADNRITRGVMKRLL